MRKNLRIRAFATLSLALFVVLIYSAPASAQSLTTGALTGTVTDQTGAVVPGAKITCTNVDSGTVQTTTTNTAGTYHLPLLEPGRYHVRVEATGFRVEEQGPVAVSLSQTSNLNITLEVGSSKQIVEVSAQAALITTENPNTTTTVNATALSTLPNPGNDLSYVAQIAPGAVMNTTGGYGNMEFNGLPATSTNFTIDGMDANDPFLNLNNSGATNLQLGLNGMEEASINTLSFSVDQGRQGAAQVNFISKSGSNQFHGNAFEIWNGASMNAVDWFINAEPGAPAVRPFSNVNQFGGSFGGPILRDKLFFFYDLEGIQIVVPTTLGETYPSQGYEQYVINTIPTGGTDPLNGVTYAPPPNPQAAISYYQQAFKLYGTPANGVPVPVGGCPLGSGAPANGNGCELTRVFGFSNKTHDLYMKGRVDSDLSASNRVWYSFEWERGVQATYTDPVNTVFNAYSTQPQVGAAVGYTHVFSPTIVNDFNPGFYWYSAIFKPDNMKAAEAASPIEFTGLGFTPVYNAGTAWPQGRNVTNWQLVDNLTWTHSAHTFKFGENLRRTLVSDFDMGINSTPYISAGDVYQYAMDVASYAQVAYPTSLSEPIGIASFDVYAQDTWKIKKNVTMTYGLRATWNSDPKEQHSNFAELKSSFLTLNHDPSVPYNAAINPHASLLAYSTPLIEWQPRASVAWEVRPKTVFRVGAGMFSDIFPAGIADGFLDNLPNDNFFTSAFNSPVIVSNYAVPGSGNGTPGSPNNDALGNMKNAQQLLLAGFASGVVSCAAPNAPSNCIPPPGSTAALPDGTWKYPYFIEWNARVEHEFGPNWLVQAGYVGTKATELPYNEDPNGFQNVCPGCFAPYPYSATATAPDPRFGNITQNLFGANSIYHALQASVQKRMSHGLTFNLNYTYSHCIDTLSNEGSITGGFNPNTSNASMTPNEPLSLLRGDCDYDVRHGLNGSYIYTLPSMMHNKILGGILNGWELAGDLFLHSGYPFSVTGGGYGANGNGVFQGSTPGLFLASPTGTNPYAKWKTGLSTQTPGVPEVQWLNPNAFIATIDGTTGHCTAGETIVAGAATAFNDNAQTCQFSNNGRNNVIGPGFANADIFLGKSFKLTEKLKFRVDIEAYNAFNHANMAQPGTGAGIPSIPGTVNNAFTINHTQLEPTGLLGSGLGGDNSVRMVAFKARIEF